MSPPSAAIATTPWSLRPTARAESIALLMRARTRLDAAEWREVRRGLGLMAGSLMAFLFCALGVFLVSRGFLGKNALFALPLVFLFVVGLPLSGAGFLVGVVLSLLAPRRARLGRWIGTYVVGVIAGVGLLVAAWCCRTVPLGVAAVSWRAGTRPLLWSGVVALLLAHLGYGRYLAGVARWFGARRLFRCFVAFLVCLALQVGLITLAEAALGYWKHPWRSLIGGDWKDKLFLGAGANLFGMGSVWSALLWRLRRCLPRQETGTEPDED